MDALCYGLNLLDLLFFLILLQEDGLTLEHKLKIQMCHTCIAYLLKSSLDISLQLGILWLRCGFTTQNSEEGFSSGRMIRVDRRMLPKKVPVCIKIVNGLYFLQQLFD